MVVKVYISGISGNKEVKKHQQRVMMILDSKSIQYVVVDITEPGKENEKEFMQQNGKAKDSKYPLPPQLFNEDDYCGDYEEFDLANEVDDLERFLKLSPSISKAEITLDKPEQVSVEKPALENGDLNGTTSSRENSAEKESTSKEAGESEENETKAEEHEEEKEEE